MGRLKSVAHASASRVPTRGDAWRCACLLLAAQCSCFAQTPQPPRFVPMTQAERNRHYLRSLVSPLAVVAAAAGSGISHWRDTPSEWKQGGAAYGRRIANSYAYHIMRQTMMFGASSVLDEDNRYLPFAGSGAKARLKYSIESTFLARRHDGSRRFSYSRIGATLGEAALSRTWQPHSTSTPPNVASSFGIAIAVDVGFNVAREFVPFLRRER